MVFSKSAPWLLGTLLALTASSAGYATEKCIVELSDAQSLNGRAVRTTMPHDILYHHMRRSAISYGVLTEYNTPDIFVGSAVSISSEDISKLRTLPGVLAVRPVQTFSAPKPVASQVIRSGQAGLPDSEATHVMTGVDKVHAQGLAGSGVKIGIIDTGVDYHHPSLGGGFGSGFKISGGFDFVGDAYDGTNDPQPDSDPLDQCNGHGTHVTGIVGADPGNEFGISGVAYNASLSAYRVFGCVGSVTEDIVIDALLRGFNDGMDIITLSLAAASSWREVTTSIVANRIAKKGRVVVAAAGNDGATGAWFSSAPATGRHVISVGSVNNIVAAVHNATVHGVPSDPISYLSALPLPITSTLPIFVTSNDTSVTDDACNPLPDDTPDLSGRVVIIRRAQACAFAQQLTNVAVKGALVALIYNNVEGWLIPHFGGNISAAVISPEQGAFLVQQYVARASISLSFPQSLGTTEIPDPVDAGLASIFSSYGPTYEMDMRPAFGAPGTNVISTLPLSMGSWGLMSGTSMSTPFVTGSAALVLQAKGKSTSVVSGIRDLFQTTSSPVPFSVADSNTLQTLAVQGSGLIQVNSAINTRTVISPGQLLLNDTAHFKPNHKFTITNTGTTAQTYQISHLPAGMAPTIFAGTIFPLDGPLAVTPDHATVSFNPAQVTVQPGATATIKAKFTAPSADPATLPVFSGFIQVASGAEMQRVAYLGVVGSLKNVTVLDTTDALLGFSLPAILGPKGALQASGTTYSLTKGDQPTVVYRLAFGSPLVRLDLVPADFQAPSGAPTQRRSIFAPLFGRSTNDTADIQTLGMLQMSEYLVRNSENPSAGGDNQLVINGTFADGSSVQDGTYRVFLRALRVTGDRNVLSDYETFLSDEFVVKR